MTTRENGDGRERDERLGLAATLTDLGQTGLAALEAAELLTDRAARREMRRAAERSLLEMIRAARRFAGLPLPETTERRSDGAQDTHTG